MNKLNLWIWSGIALVGAVGVAAQDAAAEAAQPATAPAGDDAVRDPAELGQLPVPSKQVPPQYPKELHAAGVEGSALVSFVVTRSGEVRDVRAVRSTHPEFATAAIAAVAQWTFEPGRINGQPVNTRLEIPIAFALTKDATKKR
jgi:TonB family protein